MFVQVWLIMEIRMQIWQVLYWRIMNELMCVYIKLEMYKSSNATVRIFVRREILKLWIFIIRVFVNMNHVIYLKNADYLYKYLENHKLSSNKNSVVNFMTFPTIR